MNNEQTDNTRFPGHGEPLEALLSEHKAGNARKLYKAQSDAHKTEVLRQDICTKTALLYGANEKKAVDFNNLEDVQNRTLEYLEACAKTGAFPSMMGLAAYGFGVSRQALYWQLKHNPNTETSHFLDRVRDLIADILSSAALMRNADAVTTIFVLKNGLGFSDRVEIEPVTSQKVESEYSIEDIKKRYMVEEMED